MASYAWRAFWIGIGIKEKPDVIIGTSVHPLAAFAACVVSSLKNKRFFFEITDLWPQTLIDMGKLSEKNPVTWGLKALEKLLYRRANKIISLLPNAVDYIAKTGIKKDKVVWIPNGIDLSRYRAIAPYNGQASEVFTLMYLGRHGKANALEVVLYAAQIIQKKALNNIKIVFIGDGPEKANLTKLTKSLKLDNVEFRDAVPKPQVPRIMAEADAFILSLKDIPLYRYGISANKLSDYFMSARPILIAGNLRTNPVKESGAGITVAPENPDAIAKAIILLAQMSPEQRVKLGENGPKYVKAHYDINLLAKKLQQLL